MHFTPLILASIFSALATVEARWDRYDPPAGGGACPRGGRSLAPIISDDKIRSTCEDLVADGCAKAFITGEGGIGSSSFAKASDVDCAKAAPANVDECYNNFKGVFADCGRAYSGNSVTCVTLLRNEAGDRLGSLGFAGSCLPAPPSPIKA